MNQHRNMGAEGAKRKCSVFSGTGTWNIWAIFTSWKKIQFKYPEIQQFTYTQQTSQRDDATSFAIFKSVQCKKI